MIPIFERSLVSRVFPLNDAVTRDSWDRLRSTVSHKSARPACIHLIPFPGSAFDQGSQTMRRLFVTDKPATLAACTFVLVLLVCLFSMGSMTRYLASRALKRQTSVLARGLREAATGTRQELEQLPPIEALNCRNGASDLLAQRAFENPYVRWIGVRRAGEMICRSGLVNRDPGPSAHVHPIDDVWSVELVDDKPGVVYVI